MKRPAAWLKRRKKNNETANSTRITNDTVAEHREKILAGGRRYKYPMQYARHSLVINTIIIIVVFITILVTVGYWQLYKAQNSNTFLYRVTQIVPLPIATIDGEPVRFSDYLLNYRTSEYYLSKFDDIKSTADQGRTQLQYKKREALDVAIADAYARKVAREQNITVSPAEVDAVLKGLRNAANGELSQETSEASSQRVLGLSPSSLRTLVENSILRSKTAFAVDDAAKQSVSEAEQQLQKQKGDFEKVAAALNKSREGSATSGISGLVNRASSFGGINASQVADYEIDTVSPVIKSVTDDGYYFVKLLKKSDTQVSFAFLHIPVTAFDEQLKELKEMGKVNEYITIDLNQPVQAEQE